MCSLIEVQQRTSDSEAIGLVDRLQFVYVDKVGLSTTGKRYPSGDYN